MLHIFNKTREGVIHTNSGASLVTPLLSMTFGLSELGDPPPELGCNQGWGESCSHRKTKDLLIVGEGPCQKS